MPAGSTILREGQSVRATLDFPRLILVGGEGGIRYVSGDTASVTAIVSLRRSNLAVH